MFTAVVTTTKTTRRRKSALRHVSGGNAEGCVWRRISLRHRIQMPAGIIASPPKKAAGITM